MSIAPASILANGLLRGHLGWGRAAGPGALYRAGSRDHGSPLPIASLSAAETKA